MHILSGKSHTHCTGSLIFCTYVARMLHVYARICVHMCPYVHLYANICTLMRLATFHTNIRAYTCNTCIYKQHTAQYSSTYVLRICTHTCNIKHTAYASICQYMHAYERICTYVRMCTYVDCTYMQVCACMSTFAICFS